MEELSRRYFLKGTTAIAGLTIAGGAIVSVAAEPSLRARREIQDLVAHYPDEFEKFKAGVVALQSKAVNAQTAWYANANFHAGRCGTVPSRVVWKWPERLTSGVVRLDRLRRQGQPERG